VLCESLTLNKTFFVIAYIYFVQKTNISFDLKKVHPIAHL